MRARCVKPQSVTNNFHCEENIFPNKYPKKAYTSSNLTVNLLQPKLNLRIFKRLKMETIYSIMHGTCDGRIDIECCSG
jgi:hypothetical protein